MIARFTIGLAGSALSVVHARSAAAASCVESVFGSYCGEDVIARIAPVRGSSATIAPLR